MDLNAIQIKAGNLNFRLKLDFIAVFKTFVGVFLLFLLSSAIFDKW